MAINRVGMRTIIGIMSIDKARFLCFLANTQETEGAIVVDPVCQIRYTLQKI